MEQPMTRKEREELNALCKEVFGVSSKWQKLHKGVPELVTKTITETVPGEKGAPDTTKEVIVPVLEANGAKRYKVKFYSFEELKKMVLDAKKQRDDYMAKIKAAQDLAALEKKIHEQAAGKSVTL